MEEERDRLLRAVIDTINEISSISEYRSTVKKQCHNLARRLKLLIPMFEEIKEVKEPLSEPTLKALVSFQDALESAKEFLGFGSHGSKIYLVLEREQIMNKLHEVAAYLEQALDGLSHENLDISDEVKEQVELVINQFKRARGRVDPPDVELHKDLLSVYNSGNDVTVDVNLLQRITEKLQLFEIEDLTQESLALHEMVAATGGDLDKSIEKMSMLLKKIKDFVQTVYPCFNSCIREEGISSRSAQPSNFGHQNSINIPDEFRCPISLELMKDPVIVSTGQTYERCCIQKWLDAGHSTCPKTQQTLTSHTLTPNYVLRSLIAQWCEANGIEPPKRPTIETASVSSPVDGGKIEALLAKLTSDSPEDQRSAAGEVRLLAKRNAGNRMAIAKAGAIPLLVGLLSTADSRTQEHAVTALLNLSIYDDNKAIIISSGALPGIVHVLKKGSMEARENAAATLFSLSVVDENKVKIGASGAIPHLVTLLSEGTHRGKKDAATALFNLCIFQGNKGKAVRAGLVPILVRLLKEAGGGMVDEALAILAILASHSDGKAAIGAADALRPLADIIVNGSARNKENAAAVIAHLSASDQNLLAAAQELGLMGPLMEMAQSGTERGKRKAALLIERLIRYGEQQQQQDQDQDQDQAQAEVVPSREQDQAVAGES
ncbi:U-box domain-containing protein 13 [Dionaea muscipula]